MTELAMPFFVLNDRGTRMKKKLMLIINPVAGKARYKDGFGDVMRLFSEGGYRTTVFFTEARGDATQFAQEFAPQFDMIACIGGDGTLSEVIAGLMQLDNPPPLGYIPLGSTNDVANTLGLPKDPVEAAKLMMEGTPHPFDVGGFQDSEYFTYVAAFGAFTEVSYATPQNEKAALGYLAYMLHAAGALSKLESIHVRVDYEGGTIEGDVLYGGISNSTRVAGVVKLRKDMVSLSDGKFEVLLVPTPKSLAEFTRSATGLLGQKYNGVDVILIQSSDLTVTFDKPVSWTRDGEDGGAHQVVHLKNYPSAVQIIVK